MLEHLCDHMPGASGDVRIPRRVLVSSTAQARRFVAAAVAAGDRVAVGGANREEPRNGNGLPPRAYVDLSAMNAVYFDTDRGAFAVEAGARSTDVQRTLYQRWGVMIPPVGRRRTCGPGCHRPGAAHGLADEYHCAVEIVLVNAYGQTRSVVATSDPDDPHRDLWLAHTTVGAEQFGLVTRYWFRSPGTGGDDPAGLLPRAPVILLSALVVMPNGELGHGQLPALLHNYRRWQQRSHTNSAAVYRSVFGGIALPGAERDTGVGAVLALHVDSAVPDAERMLRADRAALTDGLTLTEKCQVLPPRRLPWLDRWHSLSLAVADPGGVVPVHADCGCEMCRVTTSALRGSDGSASGSLIALDAFSYGANGTAAGTAPDAPGPAHVSTCRLQARTAKAAWDPRGVFL
ncbi:hypothetical protein ACIQAC_38445 [Streptomyces sp. NPDC088387]|uniref:hypothetical protein n=1 Tax=Streptomyces sp. NPDC088387 TaxID=3365859 RepID=UPI003821AFE9